MLLFRSRRLLAQIYAQEYLPQRLRTRSPHTIKGYEITLRFFQRFLDRPPQLRDLTDDTLSRFAMWRRESVQGGTVNRDLNNICAFWRWCHAKGYVRCSPTVELEHVPTPAPIALTQKQINDVWQSIQNEPEYVGEVPGPVWWSALFLLCWDTGERIGALTSLRRRDVSPPQSYVKVLAEYRKGNGEDRLYRIDQQTAQALSTLLACYEHHKENYRVFRFSQNKSQLWKRLGGIMERAGLPDSREYKFHCFRKSHVSHLEAAGIDASRAVGHSSRRITERHYIDERIAPRPEAVRSLFRPGG